MPLSNHSENYINQYAESAVDTMMKTEFLFKKNDEKGLAKLEKSLVQELETTKLTIDTLLKEEARADELSKQSFKFITIKYTLLHLAGYTNNKNLKSYLDVIEEDTEYILAISMSA